ncbi:LOW QUALITY PROTEIN: transcriptional regulator, LysR family [Vibrio sp. JCM 18904]|nr:LOW QUALITY PROTEIN: transcriptional regulator, LysR family [Vibrio sp. JCM 18904]
MLKGSEYPSIRALRTFVAVSNYLSFSKAADALCITQSAVSKQIASLEQLVGLPLIQRRASGIELTEEGKRYLPQVTEALELIQHATANLIQSDSKQELLTVDVTPFFCQPLVDTYLPPATSHPSKSLYRGDGNVKDSSNESDLHIRCLPLSTHYEYSHLLCEETLLLVGCTNAPAIESVHAVSNYPFIPQITRPQLWEQFKTVYTVESPVTYQPVGFEHFYLAYEAVKMGKGLALLPDFMAQNSILRGDIQHILNLTLQSGYGYYVMIPNYRLSAKKVAAFYEWLKSKLS